MSLLATLARARGVPVNTEILLGTFPGGGPGASEWISGFAVSLLIAGVVGLAYGQGFEILAILGGVLLEGTTLIHPLVPDRLPDAGTFLGNFGPVGLLVFFAGHFLFGSIVGTIYEPATRHRTLARS